MEQDIPVRKLFALDSLEKKSWDDIKNKWLNLIGTLGILDDPKKIKYTNPSSLLTAFGYPKKIKESDLAINEEIEGIRAILLPNALSCFYCSNNTLQASQTHISKGYLSWSQSSGYQSAYYGARCFVALLGINTVVCGKPTMLVDIFPDLVSFTNQGERRPDHGWKNDMRVGYLSAGSNHIDIWFLLKNLASKIVIDSKILPKMYLEILRHIDPESVSEQRNQLHYKNVWKCSDLLDERHEESFGIALYKSTKLKKSDLDFSICLASAIYTVNCILLYDLVAGNPKLANLKSFLTSLLNHENHPRFSESVLFKRIEAVSAD